MIPLGYVAFSDIFRLIADNARSGTPWGVGGSFDPQALVDRVERGLGPECCDRITFAVTSTFITELGQRLSAGILSAIGIVVETGDLMCLSAADWRRPMVDEGEMKDPASAACWGAMLSVIRPGASPVTVIPIVSLHDLTVSFHAKAPPEPPTLDLLEALSVPTDAERGGISPNAFVWMRGYARGYLDAKGEKPKRDLAIKECQSAGYRYTDAENAWEALSAEFRRPPRAPRSPKQDDAT